MTIKSKLGQALQKFNTVANSKAALLATASLVYVFGEDVRNFTHRQVNE